MIVEAAAWSPPESGAPFDLCVVGTGPAGTTLVRELRGTGLRIVVLESGRKRPDPFADALRDVECEGIAIKPWSRERILGGASSTWAGLSSPLDPIDFEPRDEIGRPGWPIRREDLVPYWEEAAGRYGFAPLHAYGPEGFGRLRGEQAFRPRWERLEEKIFLARAEAQHFGRDFADAYEGEHVVLVTGATVVELAGDRERGVVASARVRLPDGREFCVPARTFVLAAGGIENARLLLLSRSLCPDGLGNEYGRVGLGLMNHPKNYHGVVTFSRPLAKAAYWFGCVFEGWAGYAGLRLREEEQRALGVLNSYVRLEPLYPWTDDPGVEALVALVKRSGVVRRGFLRARAGKVTDLRDWSETGDDSPIQSTRIGPGRALRLAGLVLRRLPGVSRYLAARLFEGRSPPVRRARVRNFMEMLPDDRNRVTLGERRDALGLPVARVEHAPGELDRRSLVTLHRVLAEELARSGLARLESDLDRADPWPIDQDASHHLGTTRMGRDPRDSVVDPDLRLHGVPNVYVAGGSVFPTSGCANPTFTICALSIRLARHLARRLATAPGARTGGAS